MLFCLFSKSRWGLLCYKIVCYNVQVNNTAIWTVSTALTLFLPLGVPHKSMMPREGIEMQRVLLCNTCLFTKKCTLQDTWIFYGECITKCHYKSTETKRNTMRHNETEALTYFQLTWLKTTCDLLSMGTLGRRRKAAEKTHLDAFI